MQAERFVNQPTPSKRKDEMLYYALVFFIIATITGLFGFLGIAAAAAGIVRIIFFIFLVPFVISLLTQVVRRLTD